MDSAMRWCLTVIVLTVIVLVVGFLCFWPGFNYRLDETLEPFRMRRRQRAIERKLAEEQGRLRSSVHAVQQQRQEEAQGRAADAASNSVRYLGRAWEKREAELKHMRKVVGRQQAKPVAARIAGRTFPSAFQAWNPADNLDGEDALVTAARHDLIFHGAGFFGLVWNHERWGLATDFRAESIRRGRAKRRRLLDINPHVVLLMEIRYRDAPRGFLPEDHTWWKRDQQGAIVPGWEEGGYMQLDFQNADYREHVAERASAAVESGVVDGIMLDWWRDDDHRLALIKAIRSRIGKDALILANANDRKTPRTAAYINGYFMECCRSESPEDWQRIAETLVWAEKHLRRPRVNCLETWCQDSRAELHRMRATTTLSLTLSDGYCLFGDPNPLPKPDHLHDWYPFWDAELGRPLSPGEKQVDGTVRRVFSNGVAVYNPMGNQGVSVVFPVRRQSAATGRQAREHRVPGGDGDLFLRMP